MTKRKVYIVLDGDSWDHTHEGVYDNKAQADAHAAKLENGYVEEVEFDDEDWK